MNTSLLIVSLILVSSVFLPFFLLDRSGKTAASRRNKMFRLATAKNKLALSEQETWGKSFIGIDQNQKKLLFMNVEGEAQLEKLIDLNLVRDCKINASYKKSSVKNQNDTILLKLDLELHYFRSAKVEVLNFYDIDCPYKEDYELNRAEKWKAIINSNAVKIQSSVKAA